MVVSLRHNFVSPKTDGPDATLVQPSSWNEEHVLQQATNRLLGRTAPGNGDTQEIAPGAGLTMDTLALALTGQALALHQLGTNGFFVRTAANTIAARTITGTTGQILVEHGAGTTENPKISAVVPSKAEAETGNNTTKLMTPQRTSEAIAFQAVPPGVVMYCAMNTPPSGYIKANGAAVSRSTYSRLFSAIGTTFGNGNGSTTFNVPDLRAEFIRGWDDGRGMDGGRSFGSSQIDQANTLRSWRNDSGSNQGSNQERDIPLDGSYSTYLKIAGDANNSAGNQRGWVGRLYGHENRPHNVALLPIIKF